MPLPKGARPLSVACHDPRATWVTAKLGSGDEGLLRSPPLDGTITITDGDAPFGEGTKRAAIDLGRLPVQRAAPTCPTPLVLLVPADASLRRQRELRDLTLPADAKLERFGKGKKAWLGVAVPTYEIGRKLIDAAIVRFPQERPKLLCAIPDARTAYKP